MNDFVFFFEQSPWEATLDTLRPGSRLSAARLLTLLEGEDETGVEEAFLALEQKLITLDIDDLPADTGSGAAAVRLRREAELVRKGALLEELEPEDPLRLYLEELSRLPAAGDPKLLADQAALGDESARNMLVNVSLHRVITMAQELAGRGVLLLDLIQEGSLGLWQAILSWDGNGDFESYRDWHIRQTLAKTLTLQARENGVGGKLRQALEAYRAADRRLLTELGRNPTLEEIALELNMSPEETYVIQEMLRAAKVVEQAKAAQTPKEETEDDERHVEDTAYFQSRQRVMEMLSGLTEQEAKLLTLRFGLEGGLPLDPAQTGAKLGLTAEEVVRIEGAALAKLRAEQ